MNNRLQAIRTCLSDDSGTAPTHDDIRLLLGIIEIQERVFVDLCDELGCAYDNEAALMAVDELKRQSSDATHPCARYSPNVSWQSDPVWDLVLTNEELASFYNTLDGRYHGRLAGIAVKWLSTAEREDGMFDVKVMELRSGDLH